MDRRSFLRAMTASGGALALGASWSMLGTGAAAASHGPYGPLGPADANGLELPAGFRSRLVATSGQPVGATGHLWHADPDGGACFSTVDGGWIYVSNSESGGGRGGVGAIRFAADGSIVGAHTVLTGTSRNCAGGPTPWGTWLSCEETSTGQVWECDPAGARTAVARPAMGRFVHEAAAVDPAGRAVYLTEDTPDSALHRFVPDSWPNLAAGRLQVLVEDTDLRWVDVPDPAASTTATRHQVPGTVRFAGGEGAWFHRGVVWFTTKGDGRVWTYDVAANTLAVAYDDSTAGVAHLQGVDNVTVADATGDVFVAEDGGNLEVCVLVPEGAVPFCRLTGVSGTEITGPAFSPDGSRLYVSSQRNPGRTYEVTGPFRTGRPTWEEAKSQPRSELELQPGDGRPHRRPARSD